MKLSKFAAYKPSPPLRETKWKWFILFLASMMNFSMEYCLDSPQALQSSIEKQLEIANTQFNLLYTMFAIPNIFMPLIGGILIDHLGIKITSLIFSFTLILGQLLVAISTLTADFTLMVVGRAIFGIGGDTVLVVQAAILSEWFENDQLSFAMAIGVGVSSMGSSVNSILSPIIFNMYNNLWQPLFFGCILCIVSFLCTAIIVFLDYKADLQEKRQNLFVHLTEKTEKFTFGALKTFRQIFYIVLFQISILDAMQYSFMANANNLISSRFGFTQSGAGWIVAIVYACSGLCSPFYGMMTDKHGRRIYSMILGISLWILAHISIAFLNDSSPGDSNFWIIPGMVSIGIYDAIFSAVIWPSIALVVDERVIGTAYGMATSTANLLAAVFPIGLGALHDSTDTVKSGYFWTEISYIGLGYVVLILTIWLWRKDQRSGRTLQAGPEPEEEEEEISPSRSAPAVSATLVKPLITKRGYANVHYHKVRMPLSADQVSDFDDIQIGEGWS